MSYPYFTGNTALLVQNELCTSLASDIRQFRLAKNEEVINYVSTVGNSSVPYGWIERQEDIMLLILLIVWTDLLNILLLIKIPQRMN